MAKKLPGSIPLQRRMIRTTLQTYARHLQSLETLRHIPVFLSNIRMSQYQFSRSEIRSIYCRTSPTDFHKDLVSPLGDFTQSIIKRSLPSVTDLRSYSPHVETSRFPEQMPLRNRNDSTPLICCCDSSTDLGRPTS